MTLEQEEDGTRDTLGAGPLLDLLSETNTVYNHGIEAIPAAGTNRNPPYQVTERHELLSPQI